MISAPSMRPFALAYLAVLALSVAAVAALVLLGAAHYPAAVPASLLMTRTL